MDTTRCLATSVDAFVGMLPRQSPPPRMVLLKIDDTEGHDAAVLQGAADAIRHGVFDIITFEYGTTGGWANTNLSSVVARPGGLLAESAPYFCFYDGQGSAMPMSAGCFVDEMDVKGRWSNNVCFHAVRLAALVELLFREALQKAAKAATR